MCVFQMGAVEITYQYNTVCVCADNVTDIKWTPSSTAIHLVLLRMPHNTSIISAADRIDNGHHHQDVMAILVMTI